MAMPDLHFDTLFAIMERELPELHGNGKDEDESCEWEKQYYDDDLCVFMQCLGWAVIIVAHEEDHRLDISYRITDLNRVKIRESLEEQLQRGLENPNLEYTERDKDLIAEYFHINEPLREESN